MILIVLLHLSYLGMGLAVIRLLFKNEEYPLNVRLTVAYFVGVSIQVLVLYMAVVAMMTSHIISWTLLIIGLMGLIYDISFTIKTRSLRVNPVISFRRIWILYTILTFTLIPAIYLISLKLIGIPDISFDSTAFWNLKAKYFFFGENLWTDAFMNPQRVHPHQDYPLYVPIFTYEHYSILGVADDFLTKPGTWIYYLAGLALFFILIREWVGTILAFMATAIMLYTPVHSYEGFEGGMTTTYADFPLSIMIMASAGLFLRYIRYRNKIDIFVAMIFVGSTVLQKREGAAWCAIFMMFALLGIWITSKKNLYHEFKWFGLILLVFVVWYPVRGQLHGTLEFHLPSNEDLGKIPQSFPKIFYMCVRDIFNYRLWGFLGIFVTFSFLVGLLRNLRNIPYIVPAFMVIGYWGIIFIVITIISTQNVHFYIFESWGLYPRLIVHLHLVGLFLAVVMNSAEFITGFRGSRLENITTTVNKCS